MSGQGGGAGGQGGAGSSGGVIFYVNTDQFEAARARLYAFLKADDPYEEAVRQQGIIGSGAVFSVGRFSNKDWDVYCTDCRDYLDTNDIEEVAEWLNQHRHLRRLWVY